MKNKSLEAATLALAQALADILTALNEPAEAQTEPTVRLYSYDDLAQMLGKSKSTVRQWVCQGQFGEPVTVGSSTRVTQAGVDKYIADHSGPTKKQPNRARSRPRTPAAYKGPPLGI